jgi:saccharopine dehydrogenase (NAD+, L-lysine-forming)
MRLLLVGAGGVGEAVAVMASARGYLDGLVVADLSSERARVVAERAAAGGTPAEGAALDAGDSAAVAELASASRCDVVFNACDPRFVMPIFDAALTAGADYLDMAMSLSRPHPDRPYEETGVMLGDEQFARAAEWEASGHLALVGCGVEPGLSDVFARYAADRLFTSIDEVGVRDGANLEVEGYDFAPTFSIWTTIEECLNPPLVYERGRGWYTTPPFSEPEVFTFPEGIGEVTCVNVEHEEVVLVPRWLDVAKVTFKYGLGDEFIEVLQVLHRLGLDRTAPVRVRGGEVSPRDVVAACLPDPATLGDKMRGATCAGTAVRGTGTDGSPRAVYLYHVSDNEETMARHGCQAVVWQTAITPVAALELRANGAWQGAGVLGPEAFDPEPLLDMMRAYGEPWHLREDRPPAQS